MIALLVLLVGTVILLYCIVVVHLMNKIQDWCFENDCPDVVVTWLLGASMLIVLPTSLAAYLAETYN